MPAEPSPEIAYRHRLLALQRAMGKTKSDLKSVIANYAVILFITGVLLTMIIAFIVSPPEPSAAAASGGGGGLGDFMRSHGISFEELGKSLGIFLWPLILVVIAFVVAIPVGFVYSLAKLLQSVFAMRTKSEGTRCPACNAEHHLFANVRDYTYPGCNLPFRITTPGPLTRLACPHCAAAFGATANATETSCPCCEATLAVQGGSCVVRGQSAPCTGCGAQLPANAEFCAKCLRAGPGASFQDFKAETKRAFREATFDGIAHGDKATGKSAGALLARNGTGTLADAKRRIAHAESTIDPAKTIPYLDTADMDFACLQLVEVLKEERVAGAVARTVRDADRVHAKYVRTVMDVTKGGTGLYSDSASIELIGSTYMALRRHVVDALGKTDPEAAKGLPRIEVIARRSDDKTVQPKPADGVRRFDVKFKVAAGGQSLTYVIDNPDVLGEVAAELEGSAA